MYRNLKSQKGQTVVEYVLVLTIVLITVLGTVYQLNQNFRDYANNYFGFYVRCLLESGELPNLGGEGDRNSFCDDQFQPFSLAFGRPVVEGADFDANNDQNVSDQNASQGRDSEAGDGAGGGTSAAGGGQTFSQPAGPLGSNTDPLRPSRITQDPNLSEDAADANKEEGAAGGKTVRVQRRNLNTSTKRQLSQASSGRPAYFAASKIEEEANKEVNLGVGETSNDSDGQSLRKKAITQELRKPAQQEEIQEEDFNLGDMLRYLLIAAILIAIILFLASQFLAIQKSLDKG